MPGIAALALEGHPLTGGQKNLVLHRDCSVHYGLVVK